VGGFSAPLITKVLRATGYLTSGPKRVMRRLADTGHMICECLVADSLMPPSAQSAGEGWKAVVRVRMLHGMVRRRLKGKPYWKPEVWGTPINQEDMMATLLAFSYNVLVGTEMILGRPLDVKDQEAYMHLWRYIGWVMGVEDAYNPCVNVQQGKAALESIVMHLLEPDQDSIAVAHHLLRAPARGASGLRFRHELCRRFLGKGLSDALQLPRHKGMEHFVTVFLWAMRAYGRLAHWATHRVMPFHRLALTGALARGHRMGSTHQLRADLPAEYTAKSLSSEGRSLSSDALPSPSLFSACPFASLAAALPPEGAEEHSVSSSQSHGLQNVNAKVKKEVSSGELQRGFLHFQDLRMACMVGGLAAAAAAWVCVR